MKWNQMYFYRLYYESEGEYLIEGLNWKVCWKWDTLNFKRYLCIYLNCTSTKYKDWECTAQCELFWVSDAPFSLGSKQVTFNSHTPLEKFYKLAPHDFYRSLQVGYQRIKVHFKSIQIEGKK